MKKSFALLVSLMGVSWSASAVEFSVQPRIDSGFMFYEYAQDAVSEATNRSGGFSISDVMPFVGGGLTFFADRFFVDLSAQYAFDGSASHSLSSGTAVPPENVPGPGIEGAVAETELNNNDDIERTEFSISAGYAITNNFVAYAGYKRAETEIDEEIAGQVVINAPNPQTGALTTLLAGNLTLNARQEFEYDGPFVGVSYAWRFARGTLTENVGVAFLEGNPKITFSNIAAADLAGNPIPVNLEGLGADTLAPTDKGDTIGVSLGLTWIGVTPIDDFSYLVGFNGYRYDFDNDTNDQDFAEIVLRFNAGLAYSF
ncbi:MAG: hypothetical protein ACR2RB_02020 [Gammaproteobacteria bacterium]